MKMLYSRSAYLSKTAVSKINDQDFGRSSIFIGMMTLPNCCFRSLLAVLASCFFHTVYCQTIEGDVKNATGKPLAFATIRLGDGRQGLVADLNGHFRFAYQPSISRIEVSYAGYTSQQVPITAAASPLLITLQPATTVLSDVVVSNKGLSKVRRIMNRVVANKSLHNPDKYDEYACRIYYKMVADIFTPFSLRLKKDTSAVQKEEARQFRASKHLFITETQSIRHWKQPQQLQEEVTASRMSGFKTPLINNFITDVLPFHAYSDFIQLNGKDYNSPLSKGLYQHFRFTLADEILQGADTLWIIDFTPRKDEEALRGTLYIHSNGYAVRNILAHAKDIALRKELGIEQQYSFVNGRWFPEQLNYTLQILFGEGDSSKARLEAKGTSLIDSVQWKEARPHRFQKAYTVKVLNGAESKTDREWEQLRPLSLDKREARTYVYMDSLSAKENWEQHIGFIKKFPEGKLQLGKLDLNLNRFYSFNRYEKSRIGLGLQTNEKIARNFSAGGWAGYGFNDRRWKYGAFAEWYLDTYKDHLLRFSYDREIQDPGRIQLHKELSNNYVRQFLLFRVDYVQSYTLSVQNRLGYFSTQLTGSYQQIRPQYTYSWQAGDKQLTRFSSYETSLILRYAFAEKRVPLFGRYYNSGTRFPIVYGRINAGRIPEAATTYTQALAAISWKKRINRIGEERFLLMGAVSTGNRQLPLSKLFAGNGFLNDQTALHVFGGMQTMRPYDYYMDRFVNFYWEHDFAFRLYKVRLGKSFSSTPSIGAGTNLLWGNMRNREVHQQVAFRVPDRPYVEAGLLLNRLLRYKFYNVYHLAFNIGAFRHFAKQQRLLAGTRLVFGLSTDL